MEKLILLWLCTLLMNVCVEKTYSSLTAPLMFAERYAKNIITFLMLLMVIVALVTGFFIVEWYVAILIPIITAIVGRLWRNMLLSLPGFWFIFVLSIGGYIITLYFIIKNNL